MGFVLAHCTSLWLLGETNLPGVSIEDDEVKELAIIYKKETSRPLSKYQKAINEAAQIQCIQQPSLLRKRQTLLELARDKLIADGFQFVKGKSHSKKLWDPEKEPQPKRQKLSQDIRDRRIGNLKQDIADLKERIRFKEKRISERLRLQGVMKRSSVYESMPLREVEM